MQNRVWTSDRLATRGWPRNDCCPLCRQSQETAHHLLADCRYTRRVWMMIADWTHYLQLRPTHWEPSDSVLQWWLMLGTRTGVPRSGLRSLILLVVWEIWKERNARTFHRKEQSATNLLLKIKEEARAWGLAGAKRLASLLSGGWERLLFFCIVYLFFLTCICFAESVYL